MICNVSLSVWNIHLLGLQRIDTDYINFDHFGRKYRQRTVETF